jgi:DNA helicase II / ATP-dependent DNA helicase PcrA
MPPTALSTRTRDRFKRLSTRRTRRVKRSGFSRRLTDSEEGVRVASDIFETRNRDHVRWQDFAILYRTNAQSRIFEEMLRKKNIPYRVYGGLSFYERKEIRDILAYFRMIVNPFDEEAFRRSINFPRRGIGDTTIARMFELALINETSVWSIARSDRQLPRTVQRGHLQQDKQLCRSDKSVRLAPARCECLHPRE